VWTTKFNHKTTDKTKGFNKPYMVVTDNCGNVYVAGTTSDESSSELIVGLPTQKVFVTKFDANGVRQWSKILWTNNNQNAQNSSIHEHNFVKLLISNNELFVLCNGTLDEQRNVSMNAESQMYVTHYTDNNNSTVTESIKLKRVLNGTDIWRGVSYIAKISNINDLNPLVLVKQISLDENTVINYNVLSTDATIGLESDNNCHHNKQPILFVSGRSYVEKGSDTDPNNNNDIGSRNHPWVKLFDKYDLSDEKQRLLDITDVGAVRVLSVSIVVGKKAWMIIY
jgi:hypothetical protein